MCLQIELTRSFIALVRPVLSCAYTMLDAASMMRAVLWSTSNELSFHFFKMSFLFFHRIPGPFFFRAETFRTDLQIITSHINLISYRIIDPDQVWGNAEGLNWINFTIFQVLQCSLWPQDDVCETVISWNIKCSVHNCDWMNNDTFESYDFFPLL